MTTGEKIRNRRIALQMTMEDLGKAIGVQRSAINKYEKGLVDIRSKTLNAIANALNIAPVLLLPDPEDEDIEQYVSLAPRTDEARILAAGVDRLPLDQRRQILAVVRAMYPDEF